jgi:hypothetical protein
MPAAVSRGRMSNRRRCARHALAAEVDDVAGRDAVGREHEGVAQRLEIAVGELIRCSVLLVWATSRRGPLASKPSVETWRYSPSTVSPCSVCTVASTV